MLSRKKETQVENKQVIEEIATLVNMIEETGQMIKLDMNYVCDLCQ